MSNWKFVTNHGAVLLTIYQEPQITGRDLANRLKITERSVQTIVRDLAEAGYIHIGKVGRKNAYSVHEDQRMRHPQLLDKNVIDLLNALS